MWRVPPAGRCWCAAGSLQQTKLGPAYCCCTTVQSMPCAGSNAACMPPGNEHACTSCSALPHPVPARCTQGLTAVVKDCFAVAGTHCSNGSPAWLATHPAAERHAAAVQVGMLVACGAGAAQARCCLPTNQLYSS